MSDQWQSSTARRTSGRLLAFVVIDGFAARAAVDSGTPPLFAAIAAVPLAPFQLG